MQHDIQQWIVMWFIFLQFYYRLFVLLAAQTQPQTQTHIDFKYDLLL